MNNNNLIETVRSFLIESRSGEDIRKTFKASYVSSFEDNFEPDAKLIKIIEKFKKKHRLTSKEVGFLHEIDDTYGPKFISALKASKIPYEEISLDGEDMVIFSLKSTISQE